MVKEVLDKLDAILDEPGESCCRFIQKALEAIEDKDHEAGFRDFDKAVDFQTNKNLFTLRKCVDSVKTIKV